MDRIKALKENKILYFDSLNMTVEKSNIEKKMFEVKYVFTEDELNKFLEQYVNQVCEIIDGNN